MSDAIKCDFCSSPNPRWEYSAHSYTTIPSMAVSQGSWYACDLCAALIEAGDRVQLAVRCVDALIQAKPELAKDRNWCIATATMVQKDFFKNRTGPVVEIIQAQEAAT